MVGDLSSQVKTPKWAPGFQALRGEMDAWIRQSGVFHLHIPFLGVHDEGSFIASWLCHYQLTKDPFILEFAHHLRDGLATWAEANFVGGFFPDGEVHHQTEIFTTFLLRLWRVAPDDLTAKLILDAAQHVGNWAGGYPEWYDWGENRFRGWHIGTVSMGQDDEFEVPDHFRLIQLALGAFEISSDERYRELSLRWSRKWAEALLQMDDTPPLAMSSGGRASQEKLASARGDHHSGPGTIGRFEPFVASGAVDVLLDLYVMTQEGLFANAARALCAPLVKELQDPYANPCGALVHRYRVETGDQSFDAHIARVMDGVSLEPPGQPVMLVTEDSRVPIPGIGKRADMVRWAYRDETGLLIDELTPAPSALMLAYQATGTEEFAARALEIAGVRLSLARRSLRDGRRHGCSGRSVGAVASGHGRDSGYGSVTGCFYALANGAIKRIGQEMPAVDLMPDGSGLPADAAALTRSTPGFGTVASVWHDEQIRTVEAETEEE